MIDFARRIAADAARLLLERLGHLRAGEIDFKGRRDLVTAADRAAEGLLAEAIEREFPGDAILGEERVRKAGHSGRLWIVDPLDGTTNFVHAHPMFCVSVALAEGYRAIERVPPGGPANASAARDEERAHPRCEPNASGFFAPGDLPRPLIAVIHAPRLREEFWAERGKGAWMRDTGAGGARRMRVSETKELADALLATGFAYRMNEVANDNCANFTRLARRARGIRRGGSAALDLAYTAAGRFDGFWELYLKPWDAAAGILLVEEAGGRVSDVRGRPRALEGTEVLASNGGLHEAISALLDEADPAWALEERRKLRAGE